jgi:hypothetical protein
MPRLQRAFQPAAPQWDPDDPTVMRATARAMADQLEAEALYAEDPWVFCRDLVHTFDEATIRKRRFPDRPYLELLCRRWQVESLLAVPKSRRMFVTWALVSFDVHCAIFNPGAKIVFMARKEGKTESEGSNELVKRARYIVENLDPVLPPIEHDYHTGMLRFANGSEIIALGQGADQARQLTCTRVLADEIGFWDQAYETWTALRPTIEGGGKIAISSSAAPGVWKDIVEDQLGL